MRLLVLIRIVMLCVLVTLTLALLRRPHVVLGQGACQTFDTLPICCISPGCTNPNSCANEIQSGYADGYQSITYQNVTCTPAKNNGGSCGSFTTAVPFDDPSCYGGGGSPCFSDDDCNDGYYCSSGKCVAAL